MPNARPEKDQSGKSVRVTGNALPAVRIPDSTGRTAPNQYDSDSLPEMRRHVHHMRNGLNQLGGSNRKRRASGNSIAE